MIKKTYIIILLIFFSYNIFAQPTPPDIPGGGHGQTNNQPGGGAPIDGGIGTFLILSSLYFIRKNFQKCENETK